MRIAYLIDKEAVGGGNAYIAHERAAHTADETAVFYAAKGDCRAARLNAWKPDLTIVNHLRALLQLYANPFVKPSGKVVFIAHGIHLRKFDFLPKTAANRLKRFLRLKLERYLYRKVDSLIALNREDERMLREVYGVMQPIEVKPNSVPPREPVTAGEKPYRFVSVGRFDFPKGQDILIEAIAKAQMVLRAAGKRTLLVGGGATLEPMKALAAERGVADLIDFAGEKPNGAEEMRKGDFFVAPSRWEGSPYAVLEALAQGIKVIGSACPGNTDFIHDGVNGRLFPTGDAQALAKLLEEV